MLLSEMWSDGPGARRIRLAVGGLVVAAVTVGSSGPTRDGHGITYVLALAAAATAWALWSLLPTRPATLLLWPLAICVAGAIVFAAGRHAGAALAFPLLAVAAAAERQSPKSALVVAATAAASLLAAAAYLGTGTAYLAAFLLPTTGFLAGRAPRQHIERAEQAELLLAEAQRAQEEQNRAAALEERVRIAREIHDLLAHTLAALAIQLEIAQALLVGKHDPDGALASVERSQSLVTSGITETRQAVAALRGNSEPLGSLLKRLIESYRNDYDAEASCTFEGEPRQLSAEADLACRRIAQEALTNVRRHAPGAAVWATLSYAEDDIVLAIRNPITSQPTPSANASGGFGLAGMHERAALVGGTVTVGPVDDTWQVQVRLPA